MKSAFRRTTVTVNGKTFVPYLSAEQIQKRVADLAAEISRDFSGRRPVLIGILNGAFMFFADLVRCLTFDFEVDFVRLASYGKDMQSSGTVRVTKDVELDLDNRAIVLVEDIVDTGHSIDAATRHLSLKHPASISIVTLLHKPAQTVIPHTLDYVGFVIPPRFVIGYGLDYDQQARNLPEIFILPEDGDAAEDTSTK